MWCPVVSKIRASQLCLRYPVGNNIKQIFGFLKSQFKDPIMNVGKKNIKQNKKKVKDNLLTMESAQNSHGKLEVPQILVEIHFTPPVQASPVL